jgi:transposon tn21 resolvase
MIFNYKRVSTIDQSTERQLLNIKYDREFEDKLSGKDRNRPQLELLLSIIRKGDLINVHSMDRLARNTRDLLNLVEEITSKGVTIKFHKENLTFESGKNDPYQKLMMTMLGAVAELERSLLLERQKEGIALAKMKGKYKGGKHKLSAEKVSELKKLAQTEKISLSELARKYHISRPTLYSYLKN